jgi:hypothetical protein
MIMHPRGEHGVVDEEPVAASVCIYAAGGESMNGQQRGVKGIGLTYSSRIISKEDGGIADVGGMSHSIKSGTAEGRINTVEDVIGIRTASHAQTKVSRALAKGKPLIQRA